MAPAQNVNREKEFEKAKRESSSAPGDRWTTNQRPGNPLFGQATHGDQMAVLALALLIGLLAVLRNN